MDNRILGVRNIIPDTISKTKEKKGIFSRLKNWMKENIQPEDTYIRDYGKADDNLKICAATAGSVASFGAAAGKEIMAGQGVPQDKVLHAGGCFGITMTLGVLGLPPFLAATTAFATGTIGKELIWDGFLGKGCVDPRDVAANLSGSLAGYAALKALDAKKSRKASKT